MKESVENETSHLSDPANSEVGVHHGLQAWPQICCQAIALYRGNGVPGEQLLDEWTRRLVCQSDDPSGKTHQKLSHALVDSDGVGICSGQFEQYSRGTLPAS